MGLRHIYEGTDGEDLTLTITANEVLDAQAVEVSLDDGVTWLPATKLGVASKRRKVSVTLTPANTPAPLNPERPIPVLHKVDDVIGRCGDDVVVHNVG